MRIVKMFFDARVIVYGVVLPAAIYMTAAISFQGQGNTHGQTTQQLQTGTEVVAVLFTSSSCAGNHYDGFQRIVGEINTALDDRGRTDGWTPRRVGVALDWDTRRGIETLEAFGPWDEIAVGDNWVNTAAMRYMVVDMPGEMTIPQIVLVQREITVERGQPLQIHSEREILRVVGADKIHQWLDDGIPFETLAGGRPTATVPAPLDTD